MSSWPHAQAQEEPPPSQPEADIDLSERRLGELDRELDRVIEQMALLYARARLIPRMIQVCARA